MTGTKPCVRCGARVVVNYADQEGMREHPDEYVHVLCMPCANVVTRESEGLRRLGEALARRVDTPEEFRERYAMAREIREDMGEPLVGGDDPNATVEKAFIACCAFVALLVAVGLAWWLAVRL